MQRIRPSGEALTRANASFDNLYQFTLVNDLPKVSEENDGTIEKLLGFSGLTQSILDAEI
jgi:hypothetical protein